MEPRAGTTQFFALWAFIVLGAKIDQIVAELILRSIGSTLSLNMLFLTFAIVAAWVVLNLARDSVKDDND